MYTAMHCTKNRISQALKFKIRSKYNLFINFLTEKRPHFPSPESSKQ